MSERLIDVRDVLPGDVVRQVIREGFVADPTVIAVEVRAGDPVLLPYGRENSVTYLLSRPLPTAPYTLVVPLAEERSTRSPLILDYATGGSLRWAKEGRWINESEVEDRLADGWQIIEPKGEAE